MKPAKISTLPLFFLEELWEGPLVPFLLLPVAELLEGWVLLVSVFCDLRVEPLVTELESDVEVGASVDPSELRLEDPVVLVDCSEPRVKLGLPVLIEIFLLEDCVTSL